MFPERDKPCSGNMDWAAPNAILQTNRSDNNMSLVDDSLES